MTEKNIKQKLCEIQSNLKAPKGQWNAFSKFKYRSCEDILEALKPFLEEYQVIINLSDTIVQVGDRYYIKAQAIITDTETSENIYTTAFAREDEVKKGMDGSQITGTASSYARKYALNGLLAIDDTKDSDTLDNRNQGAKSTAQRPSNKSITLDMAKDIVVSGGEYKDKTLWEVAQEDKEVIAEWYQKSSGDRKQALKLILDEL